MLGQEIMRDGVRKQHEYLMKKIHAQRFREDANPAITYWGQLYEENMDRLNKEGLKVSEIKNDKLTAEFRGLPVYLITVDEEKCTAEDGHNTNIWRRMKTWLMKVLR